MKNLRHQLKMTAVLVVIMAVMFGNILPLAWSQDLQITAIADSVTVAQGKNGEYVRVIITEKRSLNGVSYEKSLPVMFFQDLAVKAKTLKAGSKFSAIVTPREFRGIESYTALSLSL